MVIKMKKFAENKVLAFIYSIFSGLAYFLIALTLILENTGTKGIILAVFFFPAIVCGMALVQLKLIGKLYQEEKFAKMLLLVIFHIILLIFGIIFLCASLFQ